MQVANHPLPKYSPTQSSDMSSGLGWRLFCASHSIICTTAVQDPCTGGCCNTSSIAMSEPLQPLLSRTPSNRAPRQEQQNNENGSCLSAPSACLGGDHSLQEVNEARGVALLPEVEVHAVSERLNHRHRPDKTSVTKLRTKSLRYRKSKSIGTRHMFEHQDTSQISHFISYDHYH